MRRSNHSPMRLLRTLAFLTVAAGRLWASPVTVDTEWLANRLSDPELVLVDMSADAMQYRRFHLPGARYLPPAVLMSWPCWNAVRVQWMISSAVLAFTETKRANTFRLLQRRAELRMQDGESERITC